MASIATTDTPFDGEVRTFNAKTHFADVLVGYQTRFGELTAKAFIGASLISHDIAPFDAQTVVTGSDVGVKGVLEFWLNMGPNAWGSLDLSWSTAHETRTARFRTGYRVWPSISVGLEAGVNIDAQGECRMQGQVQRGLRHRIYRAVRRGRPARLCARRRLRPA